MAQQQGYGYVNRQLPEQYVCENYKHAKLEETITHATAGNDKNMTDSYIPLLVMANKLYRK